MKKYTTEYVKNLITGESFVFDVEEKALERLDFQKKRFQNGRGSPFLGRNVKDLVMGFEFSLFPSYKEVLKIFIENGFTILSKSISTKLETRIWNYTTNSESKGELQKRTTYTVRRFLSLYDCLEKLFNLSS